MRIGCDLIVEATRGTKQSLVVTVSVASRTLFADNKDKTNFGARVCPSVVEFSSGLRCARAEHAQFTVKKKTLGGQEWSEHRHGWSCETQLSDWDNNRIPFPGNHRQFTWREVARVSPLSRLGERHVRLLYRSPNVGQQRRSIVRLSFSILNLLYWCIISLIIVHLTGRCSRSLFIKVISCHGYKNMACSFCNDHRGNMRETNRGGTAGLWTL